MFFFILLCMKARCLAWLAGWLHIRMTTTTIMIMMMMMIERDGGKTRTHMW